MVTSSVKSGLFMGFGAVLVVIGAIMVVFWPPLFTAQLQKMMILAEDSMSFSIWRETPIPMYLEFHMFNITNVEDILARKEGVKVKVEEVGPYVFREVHIKIFAPCGLMKPTLIFNKTVPTTDLQDAYPVVSVGKSLVNPWSEENTNLTWNDNGTLTFYNQRWWHYEPDMSVGELSDVITSINPIIATVAFFMRDRSPLLNVAVDSFLRIYHTDIFLSANVSSWVFEGIDDPVLRIAEHLPFLPINIPYDKFGWFYERNGSLEFDGSFTMNTGAKDFSQLGNVEKWRFSNRTEFRDECGAVKGSTGELWAPEYGQEEVYVFSSDLCTFLTLSKDRDVSIQGIDGVQYAANDSTFDNGHHYPHMACFCDEPVPSRNCLPSGTLNVSHCRFGAPAFVSLPHFYQADPYYPSKIDGLNATDDMNFRLALEMFTGMPLGVSAQLQINLLIRHVSGITLNNILPDADTMVPMFWFRQEMEITPEYANTARFALRVRYWVPYALYALTVAGLLLLVAGIVILIRKILISPETKPILSEGPTSANDES